MPSALLKDRLANILRERFLVDTRSLRSWKYLEDLGITQPEKKELINLFEAEFKIELSEKDERQIRTVRDTVSILHHYLDTRSQLQSA